MVFKKVWEDKIGANLYGEEMKLIESFKKLAKSMKKLPLNNYMYNYMDSIKEIGGEPLFWAMITLLSNSDIIDWGTSIRNGWTSNQEADQFIKELRETEAEKLYNMLHEDDE